MKTAGIREARHRFSDLLEEVRQGREVLITHHGRPAARLVPLVPPPARRMPFPDYSALRKRLKYKGEPASGVLIRMRREEARY